MTGTTAPPHQPVELPVSTYQFTYHPRRRQPVFVLEVFLFPERLELARARLVQVVRLTLGPDGLSAIGRGSRLAQRAWYSALLAAFGAPFSDLAGATQRLVGLLEQALVAGGSNLLVRVLSSDNGHLYLHLASPAPRWGADLIFTTTRELNEFVPMRGETHGPEIAEAIRILTPWIDQVHHLTALLAQMPRRVPLPLGRARTVSTWV
jgi:hypothetical protein